MSKYQELPGTSVPVRMWTDGVPVEGEAQQQLRNVASLPIVTGHVAVMPDVHVGYGATIGSVIPTVGAVIPSAVGVDIGCGMVAARTSVRADQLPDDLAQVRSAIEQTVPVGNGPGGNWDGRDLPTQVSRTFDRLAPGLDQVLAKHPKLGPKKASVQVGTLGGGNHFVEICLDEDGYVWVMLHSGSRGAGNRIGTYFISAARARMEERGLVQTLPDKNLAYLVAGEDDLFEDYVEAVGWAQDYARANRDVMLAHTIEALRQHLPPFQVTAEVINCHHNYVARESLFGRDDVYVTRKGAVSARAGEMGIIPGSMGAKSFIVRGKGNPDSLHSCSHGAGRVMSRTKAKAAFTVADHEAATAGVECRKDTGVLDETPAAYKDIEQVMAAQSDLVDVVHTLKQVVCVKG